MTLINGVKIHGFDTLGSPRIFGWDFYAGQCPDCYEVFPCRPETDMPWKDMVSHVCPEDLPEV